MASEWWAVVDDAYGRVRVCRLQPVSETEKTINTVATEENGWKRRWNKRDLYTDRLRAASAAQGLLDKKIVQLHRTLDRAHSDLSELRRYLERAHDDKAALLGAFPKQLD